MKKIFIILVPLIMLTACSSTIDDVSLKPITRNEESSAKLISETINTVNYRKLTCCNGKFHIRTFRNNNS